MSDVLVVWNAVKQLDVVKVDKKEIDVFVSETCSKDRLASKRLEDLQSDVSSRRDELSRIQEKFARVQDKCMELDGKVDGSERQITHWEQMWEKLAALVDDLVTKIDDLQRAG